MIVDSVSFQRSHGFPMFSAHFMTSWDLGPLRHAASSWSLSALGLLGPVVGSHLGGGKATGSLGISALTSYGKLPQNPIDFHHVHSFSPFLDRQFKAGDPWF